MEPGSHSAARQELFSISLLSNAAELFFHDNNTQLWGLESRMVSVRIPGGKKDYFKKSLLEQDVPCMVTPQDFGLRRDVQKNIFSHLSSPVPSPAVLWSGSTAQWKADPLRDAKESTRPASKPAPVQNSHKVIASFGHPPVPVWDLPQATGEYLLHHGALWTACEQPASPWLSFIMGCRGISTLVPGAPPSSSLTLVPTGLFFLLFSPAAVARALPPHHPFLNLLSQRFYHCW